MVNQSALERSDRISAIGRKVRVIKEARGLTYPEIAKECGITEPRAGERISGLCNTYIIRSDLEPLVVEWISKNRGFLNA